MVYLYSLVLTTSWLKQRYMKDACYCQVKLNSPADEKSNIIIILMQSKFSSSNISQLKYKNQWEINLTWRTFSLFFKVAIV